MNLFDPKNLLRLAKIYSLGISIFISIIGLIFIIIGISIVNVYDNNYDKETSGIVQSSICLNVKQTFNNIDYDKTMCEITVMYVVDTKKYIKKYILNQSVNMSINQKIKILYKSENPNESKVKYLLNPTFGYASIMSAFIFIIIFWGITFSLYYNKNNI
jgi:hypothetical protein